MYYAEPKPWKPENADQNENLWYMLIGLLLLCLLILGIVVFSLGHNFGLMSGLKSEKVVNGYI